ncbi:unnamed protein product [Vitrella brassicaformis CCMP3155]|uniref:Uncharacterized protein n=1 Tax=Vitrella brassicaformis (strain CCMP3155) TaxID=1169540 RepID=A0A0G4EGH8_VITBC|nr:unnamed protein product [Vitrella brassicaformis CCMP3155]|eukprot:CEL94529.1 unnamed protein product [Vitrella brassicaformis CCMP3155]
MRLVNRSCLDLGPRLLQVSFVVLTLRMDTLAEAAKLPGLHCSLARPRAPINSPACSVGLRHLPPSASPALLCADLHSPPAESDHTAVLGGVFDDRDIIEAMDDTRRAIVEFAQAVTPEQLAVQLCSTLQDLIDKVRSRAAALLSSQSQLRHSQRGRQRHHMRLDEDAILARLSSELEHYFRLYAEALRERSSDEFQEAFAVVLGASPEFEGEARKRMQEATRDLRRRILTATPRRLQPYWCDVLKEEQEMLQRDIERLIDERREEGAALRKSLSLQNEAENQQRRKRWKVWLIRAAILLFNYWQASERVRQAQRDAERWDDAFPPFPLF